MAATKTLVISRLNTSVFLPAVSDKAALYRSLGRGSHLCPQSYDRFTRACEDNLCPHSLNQGHLRSHQPLTKTCPWIALPRLPTPFRPCTPKTVASVAGNVFGVRTRETRYCCIIAISACALSGPRMRMAVNTPALNAPPTPHERISCPLRNKFLIAVSGRSQRCSKRLVSWFRP